MVEKLTPRQQAKANGQKRYTVETACRCGSRLRYTSNGTCVQCNRMRQDTKDSAYLAAAAERQKRFRERRKAQKEAERAAAEFGDVLG